MSDPNVFCMPRFPFIPVSVVPSSLHAAGSLVRPRWRHAKGQSIAVKKQQEGQEQRKSNPPPLPVLLLHRVAGVTTTLSGGSMTSRGTPQAGGRGWAAAAGRA